MSFIRVKRIAGKEYAYLVENRWYKKRFKGKGKGPRQKVSKYLGRVYVFNKANNNDFFDFSKIDDLEHYLKNNNKNIIIKDLVEWELFRHNISKKDFTIDYSNKKIIKNARKSKIPGTNSVGNKEISLKINEGFLNSYTLNRLFNLKSGDSYFLARSFVEAGIEIPKEVFVGIFGR